MGRPRGYSRMCRSDRREIERRVPFPVSFLGDRDDVFWRQFTCVATKGNRRLYTFKADIVLWVTLRDDTVVKVKILEGRRAQREFDNHSYDLPGDYADRILASLREGRDAGEGLREVFGDKLIPLQNLTVSSMGANQVHWFLVRYRWPALRAVLMLELDARDRIVKTDLQQGLRAARTLETYRKQNTPGM